MASTNSIGPSAVTLRVPPRSPHGLIQEDLFPNEWLTIVACMMLNQTSRKQVEKVLPEFIKKFGSPEKLLGAKPSDVKAVIKSLGFSNRRTHNIIEMTKQYVTNDWEHVSELYGVGEYCSRSWEIFYGDTLGTNAPKDGALATYWKWRMGK